MLITRASECLCLSRCVSMWRSARLEMFCMARITLCYSVVLTSAALHRVDLLFVTWTCLNVGTTCWAFRPSASCSQATVQTWLCRVVLTELWRLRPSFILCNSAYAYMHIDSEHTQGTSGPTCMQEQTHHYTRTRR